MAPVTFSAERALKYVSMDKTKTKYKTNPDPMYGSSGILQFTVASTEHATQWFLWQRISELDTAHESVWFLNSTKCAYTTVHLKLWQESLSGGSILKVYSYYTQMSECNKLQRSMNFTQNPTFVLYLLIQTKETSLLVQNNKSLFLNAGRWCFSW